MQECLPNVIFPAALAEENSMRTMNGSTKETADTEACIFELSFRIPISILFVATFLLSLSENVLVTIVISIDKKTTKTFKWLSFEFGVNRH